MLVVLFAGKRAGGGAGTASSGEVITVDPPEMNAPTVSGGVVTARWNPPTKNSDGTTASVIINSYNMYITSDANPPTQAKAGGTGVTAFTGISSSATSQATGTLSAGGYWIAMGTVGGPNGVEGDLCAAVYVTV